jgi:hypothetical protein
VQKQVLKDEVGQKNMHSFQFPIKPPRKRKTLTVQGDFCKIIDIGRTELCFVII